MDNYFKDSLQLFREDDYSKAYYPIEGKNVGIIPKEIQKIFWEMIEKQELKDIFWGNQYLPKQNDPSHQEIVDIISFLKNHLKQYEVERFKENEHFVKLLNSLFLYLYELWLLKPNLLKEMTYFIDERKAEPRLGFVIKGHGTLRAILETPTTVSYTWTIKSKFNKGMPAKQGMFFRTKAEKNSFYIRDLLKDIF